MSDPLTPSPSKLSDFLQRKRAAYEQSQEATPTPPRRRFRSKASPTGSGQAEVEAGAQAPQKSPQPKVPVSKAGPSLLKRRRNPSYQSGEIRFCATPGRAKHKSPAARAEGFQRKPPEGLILGLPFAWPELPPTKLAPANTETAQQASVVDKAAPELTAPILEECTDLDASPAAPGEPARPLKDSNDVGEAPAAESEGVAPHAAPLACEINSEPAWETAGDGRSLGDAEVQLSAEELRQKALMAAERRQNQVPGVSEKRVREMREKGQKEALLGKLVEHYAREKTEMPMGLHAASVQQLRKHWDNLRKGRGGMDLVLQQ
mmetsp:Transcript_56920/g.133088  ORF Transcript_56920/g.133088 Transcript_56920/m.133088 type:complete len:319 (-) Transcript_56920:110-1066(-)